MTVDILPDTAILKDARADRNNPTFNYGASATNSIDGDDNFLISVDLTSIPAGDDCTAFNLAMTNNTTNVATRNYQVWLLQPANAGWTEGTGSGTATGDGATWNTKDGVNAWAGGANGAGVAGTDYTGTLANSATPLGTWQYVGSTAAFTAHNCALDPATVKQYFGSTLHLLVKRVETGTGGPIWHTRNTASGSAVRRPRVTVTHSTPSLLSVGTVVSGYAYDRVPAWVTKIPLPPAGILGNPGPSGNTSPDVEGQGQKKYTWAELHTGGTLGSPTLNVAQLQTDLAAGKRNIRLTAFRRTMVPNHVFSRNNWGTYDMGGGDLVVPMWQSGWLTEFTAFINALAVATVTYLGSPVEIRAHPNLVSFQPPNMGQNTSGENFTQRPGIDGMEAAFGLTPTIYETHNRDIINAVADAFGTAYIRQVNTMIGPGWTSMATATTTTNGGFTRQQYDDAAKNAYMGGSDVTKRPGTRGVGVRISGNTERYEDSADWPGQLASVTADRIYTPLDGYNGSAITFPPLQSESTGMHGEAENAYASNGSFDNSGTVVLATKAHIIRMCYQRAVAERHTVLWSEAEDVVFAETFYPSLGHWIRMQLGRRHPSLDWTLWCWLGNTAAYDAMTKGIRPSSLTGTANGILFSLGANSYADASDYLGRAITGALHFGVDTRWGTGVNSTVVVTYYDNTATFTLTAGATTTAAIGGGGSNTWKSVPIPIPALAVTGTDDLILTAVSGTPIIQYLRLERDSAPAGDTTAPVISSTLVSSIGQTVATVTWATNEPATSQVRYGTVSGGPYTTTPTTDTTADNTSHSVTITGLTASTTYFYRTRSADASGNTADGVEASFTTPAAPDTTAPIISAVASGSIVVDGATITWTTNENADSQVEYGLTTSYGATTTLNTTLVTSHSVAVTGLLAATLYHYRVLSRDAAGNLATGTDNTFITLAPPDTTAPIVSGVLATFIEDTDATIVWETDEPGDSQVEYGLSAAYGVVTTLDTTLVTSHSVLLSGLTAGTMYHFRALSRDAANNQGFSSDQTFTTTAPIVYTPPLPVAEYTILVRDSRTLALLGELPRYTAATWTRRMTQMGQFQIDLATQQADAGLIALNRIIEIRRDGAFEFAGIIRNRTYDAITQMWRLVGPDLLWFCDGRTIVPPTGFEFDAVADVPAETAMRGYVSRHLTAPTDSTRNVNAELDGITFDLAPDLSRGSRVNFNGRFLSLLTGCLIPLANAGNVGMEVTFQPDYAGYRFGVIAAVDATTGTGTTPVVFSTGFDNVGALTYQENGLVMVNAVYVLGGGEGAARAVQVVTDLTSITSDFRRETSIDARNTSTTTAMDQEGKTAINQSTADASRLDAQPLTVGATLYRDAWDLAYDVTVSLPDVGIEVDRRIVEVQVTLDQNDGEVIKIALGSPIRTLVRVVSEGLQRSNRVQVA